MTDFQKGRGSISRLPPPPRLEAEAKTIPLPIMGAEMVSREKPETNHFSSPEGSV